jgi:hypothetical protein
MGIEFTIQSVQIDQQEIQEYLPNIISAIQSSPVLPKKRKRRKRKPKITAGQLIQEIISDVETY